MEQQFSWLLLQTGCCILRMLGTLVQWFVVGRIASGDSQLTTNRTYLVRGGVSWKLAELWSTQVVGEQHARCVFVLHS